MEQIALIRLREPFPNLLRNGFETAVRRVYDEEGMSPEERIGFIPDGWFEQTEILTSGESAKVFVCVEIEDSHPMGRQNSGAIASCTTRSTSMIAFCGCSCSTGMASMSAKSI